MTSTLRGCAVALVLAVMLTTAPAIEAQGALPPDLLREQQSGNGFSLLAGGQVTGLADEPTIRLNRVTPVTLALEPGAIVAGPELWLVERGTLGLVDESGFASSAGPGQQVILATPGVYGVSLAGDPCPSAIRLELTFSVGMRVDSGATVPAFPPASAICPEGGPIAVSGAYFAPPEGDAYAFIARQTWAQGGLTFDRAFSGPVALAVESGVIQVSGLAKTEATLTAGSSLILDRGVTHGIFNPGQEPTSVIVAGIVSATTLGTTEGSTPTPVVGVQGNRYISPTFGYSLEWDASWQLFDETSNGLDDNLRLNNGTSDLYLQGYGSYPEDPDICVRELGDRLVTTPGFSAVQPMRTAGGDELRGSAPGRAYAVFVFTYTPEGGTPVEYAEYIECRAIDAGVSMLVITQIAQRGSFATESDLVGALLVTLEIPGAE